MVNRHYIHFFKNKYKKLTPILLIYLFWPPRASKCEWNSSEWNNLLCYLLLIISIIVTSKSKLKVCYILHSSPMNIHSAFIPLPQYYWVLVLELQAKWKKKKRCGWKKKPSNIHNNQTALADSLDHSIWQLACRAIS